MREMIVDRLKGIYLSGITSFYVPGHKHGRLVDDYLSGVKLENLDFTEIDGTDNLHHANDIIADAQKFASDYYESMQSYFLVNGTTTGIISAISCIGKAGDLILTTRDCHKSVYNAMTINNYNAAYIDINFDYEFDLSIGPNYDDYCDKLINGNDVKAVVLTYPTYNGVCYDIKKFIDFAHENHIPVIIDEAHGAHFKISKFLPTSSLDFKADIVIQSTHKMLSAFTQSSILHFNSNLIDQSDLEIYLGMFQSSSPSYLLMSSIDIAVDICSKRGKELVDEYFENLKILYDNVDFDYYKNVNKIIESRHKVKVDPFKINIALSKECFNLNELETFLRSNENIQCEYSNRKVSLFVSSIATSRNDIEKLKNGLENFKVTKGYEKFTKLDVINSNLIIDYSGEYRKTLYEALKSKKEEINLEESMGRLASEMITPYPPGIPYILPGELITEKKIIVIKELIKSGIEFEGLNKYNIINVILD